MKYISILLIALGLPLLFASDSAGFEYIGSNKCKSCHKSEKKGAQYKIWEKSSHSKAFDALKSEKALEIAQSKGLKTAPHESPECLRCHTTGYEKGGYEVKDDKFWTPSEDDKKGKKAVKRMAGLQAVGCESCHGAGSAYKSKKVMKAVYEKTQDAAEVGLLIPDEKTCLSCHNEESPTFKEFDFESMLKKIDHPYPDDME